MSTDEIKSHIADKKLAIGSNTVLKKAKLLSKVFLASNCPVEYKDELMKVFSGEIEQLDIPNDELGVVCKKQYSISVLGLIK